MRYIQLHPYNEYNSQELLFGGRILMYFNICKKFASS